MKNHLLLPAAASAAAALAMAGCGSSGPTSTSLNPSSQSQQGGVADVYKFSACMRSHGVPKFPDPVVHTDGNSQSVGIRVDPSETNSPSFATAQKTCGHYMGAAKGGSPETVAQQRQHTQAIIALASCLRAHGYPRFPDPDANGQITPQEITAAGIDVHAPGFFTTAKACLPATHGVITVAMLSQAVSHVPSP